ncbi:T-complex protein-like protein [Gryllus bimaculatus]|nr:T-complex protein-like protein [Gryllus bimaculatus]
MGDNAESHNSDDQREEAAGGTSRQRNFSESSVSGDESSDGKRLRTTQTFAMSGVPASPPKFVSLEEIIKAANGMNNLVLAHEIAVDRDFKLEKLNPPENSLRKQVRDTMHKAFWNLLKEQLDEDPPNYSQALVLLEDIKQGLLSVLLPQHTKMKQNVLEILDSKLIEQQVEAGTLNFKEYAHYVISLMGKMCAPARDEKIKELTEMTDVVEVFQGILELLDLMRLDMVNFTIQLIRPGIIASSIEYERQKFKEFLAVQQDGLAITRVWLLKHLPSTEVEDSSPDGVKKLTEAALGEAYLELLEWAVDSPFPETVVLDEARFRELAVRVYHLTIIGAILLLVASCAPSLQGVASFREIVKKHLQTLLSEIKADEELQRAIDNISVQILKDVNDSLKSHGFRELDESTTNVLLVQVKAVSEANHRIKDLVSKRIKEFLLQTIMSPTAAPVRVPPGLSTLQAELTSITGNFLRLVSHNRSVFSEYYIDIVSAAVSK